MEDTHKVLQVIELCLYRKKGGEGDCVKKEGKKAIHLKERVESVIIDCSIKSSLKSGIVSNSVFKRKVNSSASGESVGRERNSDVGGRHQVMEKVCVYKHSFIFSFVQEWL